MGEYILGLDIGGTNIRIGAVDKESEVHYFEKVYQKTVFTNSKSVDNLIEFISNYISKYQLTGQVVAIAIAVPATISKDCTTVLQAPSLPGFDNLNLLAPLEEYFGIKVFLLKDVWTAALYDIHKYHLNTGGLIAACYVGTGIGNVFLYNGEIYKGKNGVSGELGHIPIPESKLACGCGNIGCIENYAGGKYLAKYCQHSKIDIETVFSSMPKEDIDNYINYIAIAIATEINILDPDSVLLGGGVLNMEGFPYELLKEKIYQHTRKPFPSDNLNLVFVSDDSTKGVVGAAMYARKMGV